MTYLSPNSIREISKRATCLYTAEQVDLALDKMGAQISNELAESNPVVLCVMIGGVVPTGMLLTRLDFPLQVDYVHATRYGDNFTGGTELEWHVRPRVSLEGRTVLIVDDILDGGVTLAKIAQYCSEQGAHSVKTAVLVEKQTHRVEEALQKADYTGALVEDLFVFGYGMDYKRYLRNAPGIYAVSEQDQK